MKIIFFGTPDYVLPILKALAKKYEIAAVVTQSPKPTGRKQFITYSPVDTWAYKRKIPVYYNFEKPLPEADLGILAAYGKIIPEFIISRFPSGILNVHPSLLPKYRGASPVQSATLAGETETGVTIIKLDNKVDHGPIVTQFKEDILPDDTNQTLTARLFARSAEVLTQLIPAYVAGKTKLKPQDEKKATYTKLFTKEDGFIDLTLNHEPLTIYNFIRAMTPWPGCWTYVQLMVNSQGLMAKKRLKILKAHLNLNPQSLIIDLVQLEGKEPVSWKQLKAGYPSSTF